MGFYIETDAVKGKAQYLVDNHNAVVVSQETAHEAIGDNGVVCVVDNGFFEAAAFIYSHDEYEAFGHDSRLKTWLIMDFTLAAELSGYSKP